MFLDRLNELIEQKGISRKQFLDDVGLNKNTLRNWELNNTVPTKPILLAIAAYFNVSVDYLLGETDVKQVNSAAFSEAVLLSPHERKLIAAYRSRPEMQSSIDKLLDVQETDVSILLEKVKVRIESGELNPANAKIAAFGGYTKPKSNEEKERLAEIESLLKSIKEMQENAE